jgi:hypothetical protein
VAFCGSSGNQSIFAATSFFAHGSRSPETRPLSLSSTGLSFAFSAAIFASSSGAGSFTKGGALVRTGLL